MKWLIWTIGGVLAAIWTGALALVALAVDWAGVALQHAGSATASAQPSALPAWLAGWIDPGIWAAAERAIGEALQLLQWVLPAVGAAAGWLEPLVWLLWGIGMGALLFAAAGSHWWLARRAAAPGGPVA